jgi:hypothetical protein
VKQVCHLRSSIDIFCRDTPADCDRVPGDSVGALVNVV